MVFAYGRPWAFYACSECGMVYVHVFNLVHPAYVFFSPLAGPRSAIGRAPDS